MLAITESIQEIIRVLQLTSPSEEQGAFAAEQGVDQAGLPGGMLPGSLAAKIYQAKELVTQTGETMTTYMYMSRCRVLLIFLRKSDCLGCAVLLCLICLTLLLSFFLLHLSLKHVYNYNTQVGLEWLLNCMP